MPATKATTNRTSKPASTTRATTAKAGAATDATIRKVVQQEQAKDNRRTTSKVTSTTTNRNQKARANGKAIEFVQMTVAADVYLTGGEDKGFDLTVCSKCAALLPDSTNSKKLHLAFHESVYRMEQQTS
jgi:hypothetical protein